MLVYDCDNKLAYLYVFSLPYQILSVSVLADATRVCMEFVLQGHSDTEAESACVESELQHQTADLFPAVQDGQMVPALIPGLRKDARVDTLALQGKAGFGPVVDEAVQAGLADEAFLAVMVIGGQHLYTGADLVTAEMGEPAFHWPGIGPGGNDRHPVPLAELPKDLGGAGHGFEPGGQGMKGEVVEDGVEDVAVYTEAFLHAKRAEVCGAKTAVAVVFAGKAQNGFDRVGDDTVKVKTGTGRIKRQRLACGYGHFFSTLAFSISTG